MLVYHTELFFCSWLSHRHLSIYTIFIYLLFRFFWRNILAPFLGSIPALVYFHFEHWFHLINFWNTTQTCEIWSSHGGCEDESLVGYGAVKSRRSRGAYCLHYQGKWFVPVIQCPIQEVQRKSIALVEAARQSTRRHNPEACHLRNTNTFKNSNSSLKSQHGVAPFHYSSVTNGL
jgi:hypothetical protein